MILKVVNTKRKKLWGKNLSKSKTSKKANQLKNNNKKEHK